MCVSVCIVNNESSFVTYSDIYDYEIYPNKEYRHQLIIMIIECYYK